MRAIKLIANIGDDHRLNVQLPDDVPPGMAEIIMLFPEAPLTDKTSSLREFTEKLEHLPSSGRSQEDIDRYIEEERASWD